MLDFNNISADLKGRVEKIMAGDGKDEKRIDSRNEYNQLAQLLAGNDKTSGIEKSFVEHLMTEYEEEFMVSKSVKDRVLDIIKFGQSNRADDNAEIKELKNFKKTNSLTKEEKNWIQKVIEGRIVNVNNITQPSCGAPTPANNDSQEKDSELTPTEPKEDPVHREYPPEDNKQKELPTKPKLDTPAPQEPKKPPKTEKKPPVKTPRTEEPPANNTTTPEPIKPEEPVRPKQLTKDEIEQAKTNGKNVADFLVGYTMDAEARLVCDIVHEQVNSDNVMEFIKGYTENKGWGDLFFQQLESEYGFEEAQNIMKDIATKMKTYFEQHNEPEIAKEIEIILSYAQINGKINEEQAEKLDKLSEMFSKNRISSAVKSSVGIVSKMVLPIAVVKKKVED